MKGLNKTAPVFIVGVPRSGTTLLAAMLAAHSRLSCGTETRFFRFLSQDRPEKLVDAEFWPDNATEFLFNMKLVDIPVPDHYGLDREQIRTYLAEKTASVPSILASLTEQFMIREGKLRWMEKSPEHLLFVRDIRRYFPQSPIIRIVRDPRDVALSLNKSPWAPSDFLDAILLWRRYDEASREFFQEDSNSLTIHYEKLIQSPQSELEKVCDFIDETFETTMLDTSKSAENLVTKKDSWHRMVDKPVDPSRLSVWKKELPEKMNRTAEALIGDRISAYGYPRLEDFDTAAQFYPSLEALVNHRQGLSALVERNVRFWVKYPGEPKRISVYIGMPDRDHWLSYKKPDRWRNILRIISEVVWNKLTGRRVYWIRDRDLERHSGSATSLIASVFQMAESRLDLVD